ncbi:hypothetical protein [Algisphaera agarilytica]|uniref:Regulator of replication initiation timing n=1 Tax=Algisphaera agarilytica TaxID=1385975 RepID=A0A7X0H5M0_9BACT|nr:hypothetical protein [Algisphaera agarilytica]MBB6429717.1 regulator of replication initiation timing [Algisphaera agarilytica]
MTARIPRGVVVLSLMAIALAHPSISLAAEDEIAQLKVENAELREQVQALTAELDALRQELAALKQDNADLANETQVLEKQTTELQELAGVATADRKQNAQTQRIRRAYDAETDRTVVTFGPEALEVTGNAGDFYFSVVYSHPGQDEVAVDSATLFLQTYRSGRLFNKSDVVEFLVNGEEESLAITGFDLRPRKAGMAGRTQIDRSDEVVEMKLDREALLALGESRSLTVHEGRVVLTFDQDDLAGLRAVALRMGQE